MNNMSDPRCFREIKAPPDTTWLPYPPLARASSACVSGLKIAGTDR